MPTTILNNSVIAGGVVNTVAGTQYEFIDDASFVQIGIVAEATGMLATVYMGHDLVQEESPVFVVAANGLPIVPDHFFVAENVQSGTRLKAQLRNPTGGTIICKTAIRVNPL